MRTTTTVVIGAGQSGLAMSRCLTDRSVDHVVLERSEVANSWRTERWDSLRLLTPNWQCRLPGYAYIGDDPDGFMTMPEVVEFITGYAKDIAAPVQTGTTVTSVRRTDGGYVVTSDQDEWHCLTVVLATGAFNVPRVPAFAEAVPASVATLTPLEYRNPAQFSGSLRNKCDLADLKLNRLLDAVDEWATANGMDDGTAPPHRFAPTVVSEPPTLDLDLAGGAIQTIIWASGFRPDYSWLDVPVLDGKGMVRHDGGVVDSPGMYLIGTPFLRRRKSSFIDGARDDAQDLIVELARFLDRQASPAKL